MNNQEKLTKEYVKGGRKAEVIWRIWCTEMLGGDVKKNERTVLGAVHVWRTNFNDLFNLNFYQSAGEIADVIMSRAAANSLNVEDFLGYTVGIWDRFDLERKIIVRGDTGMHHNAETVVEELRTRLPARSLCGTSIMDK